MRALPCLLLAAAASAAGPFELNVADKTLGNGLKVLVLEDHSIPNAALYVAWRVGSRNERSGTTGVAHFFEHMMFLGGAKYGSKFDPVMEARGGSNNAFTTRDRTVYQDWFPSSALDLVLDMEADRMGGMVFRPATVESERGVVASERRMNMEDPGRAMGEQLWANAYVAHPYQWDVLGWMVDIENWRQSDLEEFFRAHYAPNHATLVLVGDVKAEEALRLVEAKMGAIPRQPERRPIHTAEPEQMGERRILFEHPNAQTAQVQIAWHIRETAHPDFPVHEVIEAVLLHGESSRLRQALVEEMQLCQAVGGGWQDYQFDPSLFTVELVMREGKGAGEGEAAACALLDALAKEGPTDRELQKAKNGLRAAFVRRMTTNDGRADLLAETELFFGGWRNLGERVAAVERVTAADVKRVAAATFTARNRTVVTLVAPEGR
jgi:zinc protease